MILHIIIIQRGRKKVMYVFIEKEREKESVCVCVSIGKRERELECMLAWPSALIDKPLKCLFFTHDDSIDQSIYLQIFNPRVISKSGSFHCAYMTSLSLSSLVYPVSHYC